MIERYTRAGMKRIWSEQTKFKRWLDVELAALKAWEELGRVPKGTYERVKKKAKFTIKGIEDVEKIVDHDVIAFTTNVASYVGEDSKWIHLGLTSSDVVDTALALVLVEAVDEVIEGAGALVKTIGELAVKHKDTVVMGRTHGMHAEPTTLGLKIAVWYDEMRRNVARLVNSREEIAVGKMSGAVGNFAHTPPALEEMVMQELGLKPAPAANQIVQRDRHAMLLFTLAVMGGTLEKVAVSIRTMQRTELSEAFEPFGHGQKGSSAMPHKRNPITLERVSGLSRLLRANALAAAENQALWDERDISHSSVERIILPDSLIVADYMIDRMNGVLKNLEVNVRRMEQNVQATKGLYFSQTVLLKLVENGVLREKAYDMVQRNAMKTHKDGTPFYDNLLKDDDVMAVLDRGELAECFSNKHFVQHVDYVLRRLDLHTTKAAVKDETPRAKSASSARAHAAPARKPVERHVARKVPAEHRPEKVVQEERRPVKIVQDERLPERMAPVERRPAGVTFVVPAEPERPAARELSNAELDLRDRRKRRKRPRRPYVENNVRVRPVEAQPPEVRKVVPEPPEEDRQPAHIEDWRIGVGGRSVVDRPARKPAVPRRPPKKR